MEMPGVQVAEVGAKEVRDSLSALKAKESERELQLMRSAALALMSCHSLRLHSSLALILTVFIVFVVRFILPARSPGPMAFQ